MNVFFVKTHEKKGGLDSNVHEKKANWYLV